MLGHTLVDGELPRAVATSLYRLFVGYALSAGAGITLGVMLARLSWLRAAVGPLVVEPDGTADHPVKLHPPLLGAGQRGLAAVLASRAAGAGTIIVTGLARDAGKLALAREFGADHTIDVEAEDTVERVMEITSGTGTDVALDLTPMAAQPVRDALNAVRWGGRVVLAGLKGRQPLELSTDLIINRALTVVGAFSVDSRGYAEAIRLIEAGRFPLERMHTHTFGLDDIGRAIETLAGEVPGEDAVHVAIVPA